MRIPRNEINVLSRSSSNNIGYVFEYRDEIYRLVSGVEGKEIIQKLLKDKVIEDSVKRGFLVETSVCSDITLEGAENSTVLKSKKVDYVSDISEWSYEMFCSAAAMVLEYDIFLLKRGYELGQMFPSNIAFKGCRPILMDVGCIKKISDTELNEIIDIKTRWINPILLMTKSRIDYKDIQSSIWGGVDDNKFYKIIGRYNLPTELFTSVKGAYLAYLNRMFFSDNMSMSCMRNILIRVGRKLTKPNEKKRIDRKIVILKRYQRLYNTRKPLKYKGRWSGYHKRFLLDKEGRLKHDSRVDFYLDFFKKLTEREEVYSLMEIGGNMGLFSEEICKKGYVKKIVVSDYDVGAIDEGYLRVLRNNKINERINFIILDILENSERSRKAKAKKYKSDVVMMLAITHHLLLTQKIRIEELVKILSEYVNKYLIVEFMPYGLWSRDDYKTHIPEWYTLDSFLDNIEKQFDVVKVQEVKENRIAVIARKKFWMGDFD